MSDLVKVRVLRLHTNDRGSHAEGDVYETSPEHAKVLVDRRLVAIDEKAEAPAANKAAPPPANKAAPPPANKAKKARAKKAPVKT